MYGDYQLHWMAVYWVQNERKNDNKGTSTAYAAMKITALTFCQINMQSYIIEVTMYLNRKFMHFLPQM
jgi:hypothetical protein